MKKTIALSLCACLLFAAGCAKKASTNSAEAPKTTVKTGVAAVGSIARSKEFDGNLTPKSEIMIAVKTPGKVLSTNTQVGAKVKKGQLLFAMDPSDVSVQRKSGEAQYHAANEAAEYSGEMLSTLQKQKKQLESTASQLKINLTGSLPGTLSSLVSAGYLTASEQNQLTEEVKAGNFTNVKMKLELVKVKMLADQDAHGLFSVVTKETTNISAYADAQSGIASLEGSISSAKGQQIQADGQRDVAKASLDIIDAQVKDFKVYAPISGTVGTYNIEIGAYPNTSQIPMTIMDLSKLHLTVNLVDAEVIQIKPEDPVSITLDALPDAQVTGKILSVSPTIDPQTRTYPVIIEMDNPEERMKPGFFAKADIVFERVENAVIVPVSAIVSGTDGQSFVYLYEDGKAVKRIVKTGIQDKDNNIQIVEGLLGGDVVILTNQSALQDGAPVNLSADSATSTNLTAETVAP